VRTCLRPVGQASSILSMMGAVGGGDFDLGPQTVAVVGDADQLEDDPVIVVGRAVHEELGWAVEDVDNDVDLAVVVEVSEGRAAVGGGDGEARAGLGA